MTEDLRALLRADLGAERRPPLGDVVEAAIRDGLRIRRRRRFGALLAGFAGIAMLASGAVIVGDEGVADGHGPAAGAQRERAVSPQSVPPPVLTAPTALPQARSLTIHSGTVRADGPRRKATPAAMLHLLTQLIPPGRTSHHGTFGDDDLRVQLYLDDGAGPAAVRVGLERLGAPRQTQPGNTTNVASAKSAPEGDETAREGPIKVTIQHMPDNCLQNTVVDAAWPDGTLVRVDVPTCLPATGGGQGRPSRAALTPDEAVRVAADPRWGVTMEVGLLRAGKKQFPRVPVLS